MPVLAICSGSGLPPISQDTICHSPCNGSRSFLFAPSSPAPIRTQQAKVASNGVSTRLFIGSSNLSSIQSLLVDALRRRLLPERRDFSIWALSGQHRVHLDAFDRLR